MKKLIGIFLSCLMLLQFGVPSVLATGDMETADLPKIEEPPMYQYTNRMSDEEFFGKWNQETQTWEIESKIDYDYDNGYNAEDLKAVEEYVKAGDMYNAREAALNYFQGRKLQHSFQTTRDIPGAKAQAEGIFVSETPVLNVFPVSTEDKWYDFDVSGSITAASAGGTIAFLFHSINRDFGEEGTEQVVSFDAKEKEGGNPAYLLIKQGVKELKIPVSADMFIRGGSYTSTNYGKEDEILVSEWWESPDKPLGAVGGAPIDNGTRQGHIKFSLNDLDPNIEVTSARLYIYGRSTEEGKEVALFRSQDSAWDENTINWSGFPVRVLSYRDIPGEYDWRKPAGAHDQFFNVNCRLWNLPKMYAETYATKDPWFARRGTEIFLDMIEENGGLTYDWYNTEMRLNSAFRGDPYSQQCFWGALAADKVSKEAGNGKVLDGESFASLLKFMWQEPEAMTGPRMEGQININGLAFAIDSLLRYCTYFPEFKNRDKWIDNVENRIMQFTTEGFFEDGGYKESTSGYDASVLASMTKFYDIVKPGDLTIPDAFEEFYIKAAQAQMGLGMLNGAEFQWGDGGANKGLDSIIKGVAEKINDPEMLYYGTGGSQGTMPSYTSFFLPVAKMASMRSGWDEQDDVQSFLIGRAGGSHGHHHVNHMNVFAYGRQLLVDTGKSSYDSRHPAVAWQSNRTESHNTVEVNETGQKFNSLWDALYDLTDTTMYMNPKQDFYNGVSRAYDEATHTRKVSFIKDKKYFIVSDFLTTHQLREAGYNTYNQTWHFPSAAKQSIDPETGVVKTNFTSGANISINPVGKDKLDSATLDAGPMGDKFASYKVSVDTVENAVINTVLYPTENQAVEVPTEMIPVDSEDNSATAFSLKLPDGTDATYYVNNDISKAHRFSWYDALSSSYYMETNTDGKIKMMSATDVSYVNRNGQPLMEASDILSDLSVSFNGTTANVQTTSPINLEKDYIRFNAPENIELVMFNDELIPFVKMGDDILIGKYTMKSIAEENEDGTKTVTMPEMTLSYPVVRGNAVDWAKVEIQEGTKLTGSKKWTGNMELAPIQDSDKKLGSTTFGDIPFTELSSDRVIIFSFPGNSAWRAAVEADGTTVMPNRGISSDSLTLAEEVTANGDIAYYEGTDFAKVYSRQLGMITVYSEKSGGGGNGGGGGSSGGNGGGGIPNAGHLTPTAEPSASPSPSPVPSTTPSDSHFNDVDLHWAKDDINYMAEQGYVNGDSDGNFYPDRGITRAETVAMLSRVMGLEDGTYTGAFADVTEDKWYMACVEAAKEAGIVEGDGGLFNPDAQVTRAQLSKMAVLAYEKLSGQEIVVTETPAFTDGSILPDWAKPYIDKAYSVGIINGMDDGSFSPDKGATRAETVTILRRMLDKIKEIPKE